MERFNRAVSKRFLESNRKNEREELMKKIVVFYDSNFPYAGERPDAAALRALGEGFAVADAAGLAGQLKGAAGSGCFVNLHGPFFPKEAWDEILSYLRLGGGLVHIGGAPFRIPVYKDAHGWVNEPEQTAYHQQLQIHEALPVDPGPIRHLVCHSDIPLFEGKERLFTIAPTYGLALHVTRASDHPKENGSSGPMDAHIYALLKVISADGREVAAPAVLIENTKGVLAGGRWIMVNQQVSSSFWQDGGISAIGEWADYCSRGVTEIWLKPNYASYEPGDRATLTLQLQSMKHSDNERWTFTLRVSKDGGNLWEHEAEMAASKELSFARIHVPLAIEPGFYTIDCTAVSNAGEVRHLRQGFWGFDAELLSTGEPLSCDRDYFRKNGKPMPIVGMTYMTSDVARKFLFMPNAAVWDKDMAHMRRAGINYIRTGIWTAWRNVMFVDGHPYEEVLRAIDAFILTAKRHDIEVTFNFFGFTPETWEGKNPYLDPRSVEAQKRFISAIVSRHKRTTNVQWDLINEPSMFDPNRIFSGPKSSRDEYERAAFIGWLKERHGTIRKLQERWNMTPAELPDFSAVSLPEPHEINFNTTETTEKKGGRWLDYTLFTMEMHNRWARELTGAIKSINPNQLVTVGQDEGLAGQRPSPLFYAEAVDYTTVHSWWQMDQLMWDGIFTKAPDKPNLVQETGIMYVETPDGRAKRSEAELRNILERKYAYAFAAGGAGAVQWIWNINFYMDNINESHIGALRADGTEKPEADVSYDFGAFMGAAGELFAGRKLEDIVAVFPYSNDFSNRKFAHAATSKLSRTMCYDLKVPFRAIGEYHLEALKDEPPKLIMVPSAHNFSDAAFAALIEHIRHYGGTLLITGPIGLDEYWRPVSRLSEELGGATKLHNVLREELLLIEGAKIPVSFGGSRIAELNKELAAETHSAGKAAAIQGTALSEIELGKGRLIWCPLPVELNERTESLIELYRHAFAKAGVGRDLMWRQGGDLLGVYGRKLSLDQGSLFIFVSEYGWDANIEIADPATGQTYSFMLESERTVMFAADHAGSVTAVYRQSEVSIAVS
jgi:hypothetical protein